MRPHAPAGAPTGPEAARPGRRGFCPRAPGRIGRGNRPGQPSGCTEAVRPDRPSARAYCNPPWGAVRCARRAQPYRGPAAGSIA
jgi:hypothetical protein